ncbi:MAG TPA: TIGR00282 family metallophosphoesterase [Pirellulales bacterium]|nr:TIGR00282 family metallophosphoesterase [Pirellulales bacterium]
MRILLIGDVVGKPGRRIIVRALPALVERERLDLVVVNGENSAAGSGITPEIHRELIAAGADCITLGDHIYRRREILPTLESEPNIVKPANYPAKAPGRELAIVTARNGTRVAVVSLMGRVFMKPVDCPFDAVDRVLKQVPADVRVIVVDVHAEATSDKQLLGRYLDGRVSAVLGTHTHVPTADETVLPGGTAFQCDVGMTGPYESILGRQIDRVMLTTRSFIPCQFDVATEDVRLAGAVIEVDETTGRATAIRRLRLDWAEAEKLAPRDAPVVKD